ncbi:MAG: acetyl/propionyl/methylcrotonyl-CoA carboxylase subunit alpha [Pseudomonadales bacterium]
MFKRILIANRGAIARRIVRACEALGIESVALYSDADADAPHLLEASSSHALPGVSAAQTYLNVPAILAAVEASGADALHPGYGFLAEDAGFAEAVRATGCAFIGPHPKLLASMGDKVAARATLGAAGLPLFPGSPLLDAVAQASASAEAIGYPLLIKPAAGGGGIGMQQVASAAQLDGAVERAMRLAQSAFGDPRVFLERLVQGGRHIELQLLADEHGQVMHLFERDCSVQRRHQKLIEESPAPGIDAQRLNALAERCVAAFTSLGYNNVGTLETLMDSQQDFGVLEVNTRIQVEHAVTEMVTGVDLVASQIRLAAGARLAAVVPSDIACHGHAVEARIYAEDTRLNQASTGRLQRFGMPRMRHVRVETGYQVGNSVTPYYDPLLAKVISWAPTRELAIGRLKVALRACDIAGVQTNIALLLNVLGSDTFISGQFTTDQDPGEG